MIAAPYGNQQTLWILSGFVLICLIVGITYSNAFKAVWIYDDFPTIVNNENIRMENLTGQEIRKSFNGRRNSDKNKFSRPLSYLTFALNYYFNGYEIFGYHFVNIIIHMINACLVLVLMVKTLSIIYPAESDSVWRRIAAFTAASLWATSPLHIMAVTDIWQRVTSLAALFYLTAFLCYLKGRQVYNVNPKASLLHPGTRVWLYGAGGLFAFFLALASKENSVMLPAAILTYDIIVFQGGGAVVFKRALKYTLPLGIVILGIACLYRNPVTLFDYSWREFTLLERGLTEPRILMFYISQIFFPAPSRMNLLHHVPVSSSLIDPVTTFLSVAGIMILVVPAVIFSHRYKLFSLAIFFYFINHALESTIIPLELIYEHRNYLPSLFIYLWAVSGIAGAVFKTNNQVFKWATCILAFLCVFAQYHITHARNRLFHDPVRLWGDVASKSPGLSTAWLYMGTHFDMSSKDGPVKKLAAYHKALELNTFNNKTQEATTYLNLSKIYSGKFAEYEKALYYLKKSMEVKKFNVKSLLFLVKIRLLQKKFILADQALNSAFKYDNSNNALYIYGALLKLKLNAEPEIILEAVNRARTNTGPASEIRLIEAEALRRAGKSADAIRINEQLLEKSPSGLGLIFSLIELYRTTGQAEKLAAMVQHYRDISRGKDLLTVYRQKEGLRPYKLSPVVTRMLEAEK